MARKYRKKTTKSRKSYRKRNIYNPTYQQNLLGFPSNKIVTMRYATGLSLDIAAGGVTDVVSYRANGPYDPDVAVGGHQPMGYDQFESYYKRLTVIGSKITVVFAYTDLTAVKGLAAVGITLDNDTSIRSSPGAQIEDGKSVWKYITTDGTTPGFASMSATFSPKSFFSIKDIADNEARIGSLTTGLPAQQAYFNIWAGSTTSDDMPAISAHAVIEYTCLYSQPEDLAQS